MLILGLNLFHSDASACIVGDGEVLFAIAEERLNRRKHFGGFPALAIRACLDAAGARLSDLDHVAVGRDKAANLSRKVTFALRNPAHILNFIGMRQKRSSTDDLKELFVRELEARPEDLRFAEHHVEHHLAHIASAYYCSGWDSAAGLSYDGSGDFVSAMYARCEGADIKAFRRVYVPHSLGSFYSMICDFIGYRKYGDEGKIMGLAAYGADRCRDAVRQIVKPAGDTFLLDLSYFVPFGADQGLSIAPDGTVTLSRHYSDKMVELFGPASEPYGEIGQREMDLAFAMQERFEEIFMHMLNSLHAQAPVDRLAMAGGCALNSVANGKLFARTPFRQTWIQPAAGDEGLAIGAALYAYHVNLNRPRRGYAMTNSYLGPEFSETAIEAALKAGGLRYRRYERGELLKTVAGRIAAGDVVGWFQGRMEWGPRALGNRSILAHPGLPHMKDTLNARIKRREWFRPFAPSIMAERQHEYFEHDHPSPFMLHVYKIRPDKRDRLCAVNHVDDTGRLQTVTRAENPLYYDLIAEFNAQTGLPVVLNTSFNENEPIVCRPEEAIDCYKRTRMDMIAIGPFVAMKSGEEQAAHHEAI
jgi:carbamoyltransferase